MQYFSWAKVGHPYMGVGRNLTYKKEERKRFINHIQIRSGDDDLFINEAATAKNTAIAYTPEVSRILNRKPNTRIGLSKRRHVATANYYNTGDKLQLGLLLLPIIIYITSYYPIIFQFRWILVLSLIAVRYISVWVIVGFSADKLKEDDLKFWFPIIELVLIFTQINIFTNTFSKPVNWK
jgi:hypothetical protein